MEDKIKEEVLKEKHTIQQEFGKLSGKGMGLVKGQQKIIQRLIEDNEKLWIEINLIKGDLELLK